jgi:hypothetical protein
MISLQQLAVEALGVPNNLLEVTDQVYEEVMYQLSKITDKKITQNYTINVSGPFTIGDVEISDINIIIDTQPIQGSKVQLLGGAHKFRAGLSPDTGYKRLSYEPTTSVDIVINIGIPKDAEYKTWEPIADFTAGPGRRSITTTLAHELKHAHDQFKMKNKGEKVAGRLKYNAATGFTGLGPLDEFNYYIYYTYFIENLVRPAEVAMDMKYKGVTKKGFLKALQSSEIYKNLKKAQSISYDEMMKKILKNAPKIRKSFEDNGEDLSGISDKELINNILRSSYQQKLSNSARIYASQIAGSAKEMIALMLGVNAGNKINQDKKEAFEEVIADINRYDNYEDFYRNEEKKIKREADKVIRRLAKLYAYID